MSSNNGFMDEQGMVDLARKTIEDLRKEGVSPSELKRLENILKEGGVGESLILSGLLRTIRNEISPDASHKKLLQIYEGVEECCYCLVELSHNLFDVEAWQHYRQSGYESFGAYCTEVLKISADKAERLKLIRDRSLPAARKERTWTVLRLAVSGGRDSGRRKEKRLSLTRISITEL